MYTSTRMAPLFCLVCRTSTKAGAFWSCARRIRRSPCSAFSPQSLPCVRGGAAQRQKGCPSAARSWTHSLYFTKTALNFVRLHAVCAHSEFVSLYKSNIFNYNHAHTLNASRTKQKAARPVPGRFRALLERANTQGREGRPCSRSTRSITPPLYCGM